MHYDADPVLPPAWTKLLCRLVETGERGSNGELRSGQQVADDCDENDHQPDAQHAKDKDHHKQQQRYLDHTAHDAANEISKQVHANSAAADAKTHTLF